MGTLRQAKILAATRMVVNTLAERAVVQLYAEDFDYMLTKKYIKPTANGHSMDGMRVARGPGKE